MKDTVLVLRNEETRGLISMAETIQLLKEAYADLGHNRAQNIERHRLHLPLDNDTILTRRPPGSCLMSWVEQRCAITQRR